MGAPSSALGLLQPRVSGRVVLGEILSRTTRERAGSLMRWFGIQVQFRHPKKKKQVVGGEQVTRTEQAAAQEGKSCRARLAQPALELLTNPSQAGHAEQRWGQNTCLYLAALQRRKKGHSGGGTSLVALENHL